MGGQEVRGGEVVDRRQRLDGTRPTHTHRTGPHGRVVCYPVVGYPGLVCHLEVRGTLCILSKPVCQFWIALHLLRSEVGITVQH